MSALWDQTQWTPPDRKRVPLAFPRIIHQIWIPDLDKVPPESAENPKLWGRMNPGWQLMLWNEERIVNTMKGFLPHLIPTYRKLTLPIKRADFARIVVLLKYGGFYIDYDMAPQRPLDCLFSDPWILLPKAHHSSSIPRFVGRKEVDWSKCEMILTREYRPIDKFTSVANGAIFSAPENPLLGRFLHDYSPRVDEYVLDYLGPHALTKFLRNNIDLDTTTILPPYYFLWEDKAFRHEAPPWVVCKHLAKSTWMNAWGPDPLKVK